MKTGIAFERPMLPTPPSVLMEVPSTKHRGPVARYVCPLCGGNHWLWEKPLKELSNWYIYEWDFLDALTKGKWPSSVDIRIYHCRICDFYIGIVFRADENHVKTIIDRYSKERIYDALVEAENSIPF